MARSRARNQGFSGETPGGHRFPSCAARWGHAPLPERILRGRLGCPGVGPPGRAGGTGAWEAVAVAVAMGSGLGARGPGLGGREGGGGRRLTFLRRLHGAAGGRRGPQSFYSPADCSRSAEWKLGRGWKTGTWHPRGRGGAEQEEERAPPGSGSGAADSPADARCPGSGSRSPEKCHRGACARSWRDGRGRARVGWRGAVAGSEACARAGSGSLAETREPQSLALTQGRALPPAFLKLENTSPASRRPAAPEPPPCRDITPPPVRRGAGTGAERRPLPASEAAPLGPGRKGSRAGVRVGAPGARTGPARDRRGPESRSPPRAGGGGAGPRGSGARHAEVIM